MILFRKNRTDRPLPLDRLTGPEVWVVIRRKVSGEASESSWKFYLSNAPIETPLSTFVRVSGMRWPIETCFAECKGGLGMDHYQGFTPLPVIAHLDVEYQYLADGI
jgi:SRSO17 transposase